MNNTDALDLVTEMMAIPGPSGAESQVAEFITGRLFDAGAKTPDMITDRAQRRTPLRGQQGNLILKLAGTVRDRRRLFCAHMDTVPICVGSQPRRKGGLVQSADSATGLGADNRAGCAVLLATALTILREGSPHPPLTFLWTVQEEAGLHGSRCVRLGALGKPKLAFNFDGGSPAKLTIGATSGYRMEIDVVGIASHAGGAPEEGVSAISIAALAIADLVDNGWHGQVSRGGRRGTCNVGVIRGGAATNVVADQVTLRAEARSHDSKFRQRIVTEIRQAFQRAARKVRNHQQRCGEVRFRGRLDYEAFRLEKNEQSVATATQAVKAEGLQPELAIANGGLDANWLTARGIPTVSLGCGQRNIHTVAEQLEIAEFHAARRIAMRLATARETG